MTICWNYARFSLTSVGDLCILQRQPKILEASNLRPDFRNNMVSYHPPTHTYPKSPFLGDSEKVQHTPTYGTTFFRNSACTGMHVQSVQPALQRNRLFLTQVYTVTGNFLKNMFPYPPLNPYISEKPFSVAF